MSNQVKFAPFRPLEDFGSQAEGYSIPDLSDLGRWSNRVTNNLLYYQTNYFMFFLVIFVIISMIHPTQFITGLAVFVALSAGIIFLANKNLELQRLKRDKPFLSLAIILVLVGFLFKLFGSLMVFLFSVCLPLSLIFLHASLRLRNFKNKLANKVETIGISRTPMGCLLEALGATNEIAS